MKFFEGRAIAGILNHQLQKSNRLKGTKTYILIVSVPSCEEIGSRKNGFSILSKRSSNYSALGGKRFG